MTRSRSIAVAQTCPVAGDVQANLDEHLRLARLAAEEGAQVVVFPELSLTGYELVPKVWSSPTRLLHFSGRLEGRWRNLLRVNKLRVISRTEVHRTARRPTDGSAYSQPARFARHAVCGKRAADEAGRAASGQSAQ